jgi:uncharacterized protein (DUF1697 family)
VALPEVFASEDASAQVISNMTVFISMLRAVNVGGRNLIRMDALRKLYEALQLRDVATYVQSGNVVFRSSEHDSVRLAIRIEGAIERSFGIRPVVILRTASELRSVVACNPFAARPDLDPRRLLVTFLAVNPAVEACAKALALQTAPEELHIIGSELFTYFPNGFSQSKLSMAAVDRALRISGTGRNWNTVTKLLAMAEKLEAARPVSKQTSAG